MKPQKGVRKQVGVRFFPVSPSSTVTELNRGNLIYSILLLLLLLLCVDYEFNFKNHLFSRFQGASVKGFKFLTCYYFFFVIRPLKDLVQQNVTFIKEW